MTGRQVGKHRREAHYSNAIQAASYEYHKKVVQMLLDQGADANAQSRFYGNALHAAAGGGQERVVRVLRHRGVGVHADRQL